MVMLNILLKHSHLTIRARRRIGVGEVGARVLFATWIEASRYDVENEVVTLISNRLDVRTGYYPPTKGTLLAHITYGLRTLSPSHAVLSVLFRTSGTSRLAF